MSQTYAVAELGQLLAALQEPESLSISQVSSLMATAESVLGRLTNPLNVQLVVAQIQKALGFRRRPDLSRRENYNNSMLLYNCIVQAGVQRRSLPLQRLSLEKWADAIIEASDRTAPFHFCVVAATLVSINRKKIGWRKRNQNRNLSCEAFSSALRESYDTFEGLDHIIFLLAQLDHQHPYIGDELCNSSNGRGLLQVIIPVMFHAQSHFGNLVTMLKGESSAPIVQHISLVLNLVGNLVKRAFENTPDRSIILSSVESIKQFSMSLCSAYSHSPIPSDKMPWDNLKVSLFTTIMSFHGLVNNLVTSRIFDDEFTTQISHKCLQTLSNLHFITFKYNYTSFPLYNYLLVALSDLASSSPEITLQLSHLLLHLDEDSAGRELEVSHAKVMFYLDAIERLVSILPTDYVADVILPTAYRSLLPNPVLAEKESRALVESAHSVVLAIVASQDNTRLVAAVLRFYTDHLLDSYPTTISTRQFKLAVATIARSASPPRMIAATEPELCNWHLRKVFDRISLKDSRWPSDLPIYRDDDTILDPQIALLLAMLDAMPFIASRDLIYWLEQIMARAQELNVTGARESLLRHRLWELVSSGELDPSAGEIAARWWCKDVSTPVLTRAAI